MKIIQEKFKCIGCGSCVAVCPKYWEMTEDGKSHLINSQWDAEQEIETLMIEEAECNLEAVNVCPVQCIKIEN